jgi:O-antigen/teichoic acid export membrane protein
VPGTSESEAARATTGRSVLSGGLWYVASTAIPQVYTLIVSIVAARFLGPDGMGRQSFIAFVAITLTNVLSSSMFLALMRYIGETAGRGQNELLPGLLSWAWRVEGGAALLGGGTLAVLAALGASPQGAWAWAAVVTAVGILHAVPTAVLIGLQRFRQAAVVGLVTGFVGTPAVAIVLWKGGGITGMFAAEAVVSILNLIWTGTLARRSLARASIGAVEVAATPADRRDLHWRVARFAILSSLGLVLELVVATRSEFFFLAHYSTDAQIAFYSIAYSAVAALRLIPRTLAASTTPAFATLYGAGEHDRIQSGYSRSIRLLVIVTLPLTAAGLALGPELIEEIYGRSYAGAGTPVRILLLAFPVIALSSLANALLSGLGRIRTPLVANAVGAVFDLGLAWALVPSLEANGAAIANAVGQGIYALVVLGAAARIVRVRWHPWALVRNAFASAAAGVAGWAVLQSLDGFSGLVAAGLALSATYAVLAVVLRLLPSEDAVWLDEALGSRALRAVARACSA